MILVDANVLIYAVSSHSAFHGRAVRWLNDQLNGTARVGIPWACALAFVRVMSNARIGPRPLTAASAWDEVQRWLARPIVWIPEPTDRHGEILGELLSQPGMGGNLVTDAHLAALAIEHGLTLCSADTDFARFKQLRWTNPLA